MKRPFPCLLSLMFGLFLLSPLSVQGQDLSVSGSVKSLNLYLDGGRLSDPLWLSSNAARFDVSGRLFDTASVEFSYEQRIRWDSRTSDFSLTENRFNRVFDLEKVWSEGESLSSYGQVDRLNLHADTEHYSWSIGRQAIGFGRITLFSPLDVIAPFSPDALDVDVRPGVDAASLTGYFGFAGQLGGVAVFSENKEHNSYLLKAVENVANVDLLAIAGTLRGRTMAGAGLAGEIGVVGVKIEASHYRGRDVGAPSGDLDDHATVAALELWHRFDNGLVLIAEYLYNGFGEDDPERYPLVLTSAPIEEGLSYLLGQQYLMLAPSYELHPLVTVNGLLIYNLEDHSFLIRPRVSLSLSDNLALDLFWAESRGRTPRQDPFTGLSIPRSEFGGRGGQGGLLLRYYF